MKKDLYREMRYGKKELTITSIVVLILSIAIVGAGIYLIVRGALNPNGAWQIIWRVLLGVVSVLLGILLISVGFTMFSVSRSMINVEEGNVSDVGNRAKGTVNIHKCEKCGRKLSTDAKFCEECASELEKEDK